MCFIGGGSKNSNPAAGYPLGVVGSSAAVDAGTGTGTGAGPDASATGTNAARIGFDYPVDKAPALQAVRRAPVDPRLRRSRSRNATVLTDDSSSLRRTTLG
jgi:hypothetical protein